jgi:glycosyltransferase involved in cell wall biosynthesis
MSKRISSRNNGKERKKEKPQSRVGPTDGEMELPHARAASDTPASPFKVGIISESPSLTTGFGVTCNKIVEGLARAGYQVSCFGINASGETFDRTRYPCRIWAVGSDGQNVVSELPRFLQYENPDVLLVNLDILAVQRWVTLARAVGWKRPIISYFVIDGLPIHPKRARILSTLPINITPTSIVAKHLQRLGITDCIVAPHGVDTDIFHPLPNRDELRREAGLENFFVVGVFGRNAERKQLPRVMMALSILKKSGIEDVLLYLHCQPLDHPGLGGWDLIQVGRDLDVEDRILFPGERFSQLSGVQYHANSLPTQFRHAALATAAPQIPPHFDYVSRLNCCDCVIIPSFCGGFELSIIEAQACGIPTAVTNDKGVMLEVAGGGSLLLESTDVGVWSTGAHQHFVSAETIARAIMKFKENPDYRAELIQKGFHNAAKYPWSRLQEAAIAAIEEIRQEIAPEGQF